MKVKEMMNEAKDYKDSVKVKTVFGNVLIEYMDEESDTEKWDLLFKSKNTTKSKVVKTGYRSVVQNGKFNGWNAWDISRHSSLIKLITNIAERYASDIDVD